MKESSNGARLQTFLAVLPVLTAGFYLMGATYHQGYLAAFGIEDSLFPLPFEKSLIAGFLAFLTFGLYPISYLLLATAVLVLAGSVAAVLSSHPKVQHWQSVVLARLAAFRGRTAPSDATVRFVDSSSTTYAYIAGGLLTLLLLVAIALLSAQSGKTQGMKEIKAFEEKKDNYVMLKTSVLAVPTLAKQVICSPSHCAFWLGKEGLLLRHEAVESVVMYSEALSAPSQPAAVGAGSSSTP